ncbi:17302_t:CDS:2, partial [Racocetra fulgida]
MPPVRRLLLRTVRNAEDIRTDKYKIGLNFQETTTAVRHLLKLSRICPYCNAKLFARESKGILASIECIAPLKNLITRLDNVGNKFRNNICAYNNVFAFTSMGVKIDENLAN